MQIKARSFLKSLLASVFMLPGSLISLNFLNVLHNYKNRYFYSSILSKALKNAGENFYIQHPYTVSGAKYIKIGNNFTALSRLRLEAFDFYLNSSYNPSITIGDNVNINDDCHIGCINEIRIGNNVLIASKVFISDHFHGQISSSENHLPPASRELVSKGPVIIEDDVWIGEGVSIMPNVRIGKGSIIGANSVITKDIPEYSVAGGIPARVLKTISSI